jgi:hypothetical protein
MLQKRLQSLQELSKLEQVLRHDAYLSDPRFTIE